MTTTKIVFDKGEPTAFWQINGDTLIQGGTAWNVGPTGHIQMFPVAFAYGADVAELNALSGGRAWYEKLPGEFIMATGVRLYCDPPGHVTWKVWGRTPP